MFAIRNMNKKEIVAMADSTFNFTPPGKQQIVFIANHDLDRFSSAIHQNAGKEKIGAALNLLIGGVPCIYYGQEIGMVGTTSWNKYGLTDANGIPQREAFEWYRTVSGKGMAIWYKNTGPWWDSTNLKDNDGVSVEEQKTDPNSLWNFYRKLIDLRKNNEAFFKGDYRTLQNDNDSVYCFLRYTDRKAAVVSVNLASSHQSTNVSIEKPEVSQKVSRWKNLLGKGTAKLAEGRIMISLPAYGIRVWEIF
jgi:glycosidase